MTPHEEDRYHRRVAMFHQARGMHLLDAQQLAERLFDRDRAHDDRRSCAECKHLKQRDIVNEWGRTYRDLGCWAGMALVGFDCLHHCSRFEWQTPPGEFSSVVQFPVRGVA